MDIEANSSDESEAVQPPNALRSSVSSENLQLDLAKSAASDGLSDKENIIRQIQNQMKLSSSKLGAVRTSSTYVTFTHRRTIVDKDI